MLSSCSRRESTSVRQKEGFSFLTAQGTHTVDSEGNKVVLKGCNLGNWLLIETWMLEMSDTIKDQYEFEAVLSERFGEDAKNDLMELYRANWIQERDFEVIRSFGFNAVRIPFHYQLLEDDIQPFRLKENAFKWLDAAIEWAEKNDLYVILDMHGLPGGQSVDHTTGRVDQNNLWEDAENRKRTVWLWTQLAERYRDNPVVAAYEPINEPFGDYKTDKHLKPLVSLMEELYEAIRAIDVRHLIIIPGSQVGLKFYGAPSDHGWENVIYTEHYYPGVLYGEPTLAIQKTMINKLFPALEKWFAEVKVPFLIGEFNVVFRKAGGPALMRKYYDMFEDRGWWATMWCYKLVQGYAGAGWNNWFMVKNLDEPPKISIKDASYDEIESYFRWLGSMEVAVFEDLRSALTAAEQPIPLILTEEPILMTAPASDEWSGWQCTDICSEPVGGQRVFSKSRVDVYGGGKDIWKDHDEFRLLWQKKEGEFTLTASVLNLVEVNEYSKAGIMIRAGLDDQSPHVLLHVFPDSQVVVAWRDQQAGTTHERKFQVGEFPVRLRLQKAAGDIVASYAVADGDWKEAGSFPYTWQSTQAYAGLAVLSHDDRFLTTASFDDIQMEEGARP